jgi:hypothetical protein
MTERRPPRPPESLARANPDADLRERVLQGLRAAVSASGHPHVGAMLGRVHGARYGTDPAHPGLVVRVDADGRRTLGKLIKRLFVPLDRDAAGSR